MSVAALTFLQTIAIGVPGTNALGNVVRRQYNRCTTLYAEPKPTWPAILKSRNKHHEVKLRMAEVAKLQKKAETLQEYMRYEKEFHDLIERDDALRAAISRMIMKYVGNQKF